MNPEVRYMSTYYRAQIHLEPEQHQTLAELAKREVRSIPDLVRESVQMYPVERVGTLDRGKSA
jgi:hypothetical protein